MPATRTAATATLIVAAVWDDDGSPAEGIGVSTFPTSRPNPFLHKQRSVTDARGRATFKVRAPIRVGAYLDQGDSEYLELESDEVRVRNALAPSPRDGIAVESLCREETQVGVEEFVVGKHAVKEDQGQRPPLAFTLGV